MKTKSPKVTNTTKKTKITTHGTTSGKKSIAYLAGYDAGAKDQAKVFEENYKWQEWKDKEIDVPNIKEWNNPEPNNNWKLACLSIFLGVICGMIISTPSIISALDACK